VKISKLFRTFDPALIGQRTAAAQQNFDQVAKYCEFAAKIAKEPEIASIYTLTRNGKGLRLVDIDDSNDVFKLMDLATFANVETGEIIPKMTDAIALFEDYTFFKI